MEKAYHIATSGRKGPVHISLAMDILEVDIQKTLNTYKGELQFGAKDAAKRIAKKLMELEKPIIVAGKGVLRENSTMEIEELMEKTYIPALASRRSRDVIPFNNKLNIGYTIIVGFGNILEDLRKFLEEADGIITVGLDRGERESRDIMELSRSKRIIHIYQEEPPYGEIIEDNGRIIEVNTPNLKQLLKELIGEVNGYRSKWTNLENRIAELKGKVESDLKEHAYRFSKQKPIHPAYLVQTIKEVVKNDYVIFTIDVGGSSSWAELYLRQNKPNTLLTSDRFGNMGFTLPAAIAASKVVPEANVIGITGDGGMLMTLGEIATAVEQKSNIKVIVMNDRQYTMIKNIQRSRHGYPPFQVDIHTPNFDEIAKSFGANGIRIDDPRDLSAILEEALNIKGPTIIDVHTTNEYESYRYRL
jgi:acetolactate synthase-1/2/3 large subunit